MLPAHRLFVAQASKSQLRDELPSIDQGCRGRSGPWWRRGRAGVPNLESQASALHCAGEAGWLKRGEWVASGQLSQLLWVPSPSTE